MISKLRMGCFELRRDVITQAPDLAKKVLNDMIVVRAEMMFHKDAIEYTAISDIFEEVENGEVTPFYDVLISNTDEGFIRTVKRRKV